MAAPQRNLRWELSRAEAKAGLKPSLRRARRLVPRGKPAEVPEESEKRVQELRQAVHARQQFHRLRVLRKTLKAVRQLEAGRLARQLKRFPELTAGDDVPQDAVRKRARRRAKLQRQLAEAKTLDLETLAQQAYKMIAEPDTKPGSDEDAVASRVVTATTVQDVVRQFRAHDRDDRRRARREAVQEQRIAARIAERQARRAAGQTGQQAGPGSDAAGPGSRKRGREAIDHSSDGEDGWNSEDLDDFGDSEQARKRQRRAGPAKAKKNRPGQRQRQLMAEKLHGQAARHVVAPEHDRLRQYADGRPIARGPHAAASGGGVQPRAPRPGQASGANRQPIGKRVASAKATAAAPTAADEATLHPSWQAKKKNSAVIQPFQGKRIVFGD